MDCEVRLLRIEDSRRVPRSSTTNVCERNQCYAEHGTLARDTILAVSVGITVTESLKLLMRLDSSECDCSPSKPSAQTVVHRDPIHSKAFFLISKGSKCQNRAKISTISVLGLNYWSGRQRHDIELGPSKKKKTDNPRKTSGMHPRPPSRCPKPEPRVRQVTPNPQLQ